MSVLQLPLRDDVASAPEAQRRVPARALLVAVLVVAGSAITLAMRHTSPTFDEIVFVAAGARGYETGSFNLAPDHPPLLQYVYGLPAWLSGVRLPDETGVPAETQEHPGYRYRYSRQLYFGGENDAERVSFYGRLPAVAMALLLVVVTFAFTARHWGATTGLVAAVLVGFLPDVLGHGGVAYGDVPVTLALFGAAWATDSALRSGSYRGAFLAGALAGLAVCVKISAAILLPLALALCALEFAARRRAHDAGAWLRRLPLLALIASAAAYIVVVAVFRGDFLLEEFRFGLDYRFRHFAGGHGAAAFLLGQTSTTGWWYFFPVAFLLKTSAALHVLLCIALLTLVRRFSRDPERALTSPLRMPAAATLLFGFALLNSSLNIGFRYALPVLPMLCVITAVGLAHAWPRVVRPLRGVIVAAIAWCIIYPLSWYPHFLPFVSEYGPGRDRGHEVLVDSSLDWGQGLLELRDFMRRNDVSSVYLSYFGSADPAAYGIRYVPLLSFFPLPPQQPPPEPPQYVVISATNLQGMYMAGDPFARFREVQPAAVLAHSLYVFRVQAEEGD